MKLNNKGFTLIEVLMVVTILSIVLAITIPNTTYSIKTSENRLSIINNETIKKAINLYTIEFNDDLIWQKENNKKSTCFSFNILYTKGYLKNNNSLEEYNNKSIKVYQDNGVNSYFLVENCNN